MPPSPSALPAPQVYTYLFLLLDDFFAADLAAFGADLLAAFFGAFFFVAIVLWGGWDSTNAPENAANKHRPAKRAGN
jgi:hypothetical protein